MLHLSFPDVSLDCMILVIQDDAEPHDIICQDSMDAITTYFVFSNLAPYVQQLLATNMAATE